MRANLEYIPDRERTNIATDTSSSTYNSSGALANPPSRAAVLSDTIYPTACSDRRGTHLGRHYGRFMVCRD